VPETPAKQFHSLGALFKNYRAIVKQRPRLLFAAVTLSLAAAIAEGFGLSIIYPILQSLVSPEQDTGRLGQMLRYIVGENVVHSLLLLAVVFFLKACLLTASNAILQLWMGRLQEDWTVAALGHYFYGPYTTIIGERRGQIIQNVMGEPATAAKAVETLLNLFTRSILAGVLVLTLFVLNWKLTLGLIVFALGIGFVVRPYLFHPMERLGRKRQASKQNMQAVAAEPLFGAATVKLLGAEDAVLKEIRRPLRKYTRSNVLIQIFARAPDDFIEFIVVAATAVIFIVLANSFGVSVKEAAPLIGSFALVCYKLFGTLSTLLGKRLDIAALSSSLLLVEKFVSRGASRTDLEIGETLGTIETDIQFQDVGFSYADGSRVFSSLNVTFPKGKVIGIVGPTGIGKSTIAHLLVRLYEVGGGRIVINNRDIREYSLLSLRRQMGYVEQNPVVFNGTIAENIRLGKPKATREEVIEAATAAGLHDFIMSLPKGYDTPVSDQGATLSGGEKQRVAIARAVIRKPDVFVFDEGTSALDRKTELLVQESIQKLAGNATIILIAHRVATLKDADLIYEILPNGEAAVRSFEELAA
jgi:subfamily B ATP-binding cassette protein MsbA